LNIIIKEFNDLTDQKFNSLKSEINSRINLLLVNKPLNNEQKKSFKSKLKELIEYKNISNLKQAQKCIETLSSKYVKCENKTSYTPKMNYKQFNSDVPKYKSKPLDTYTKLKNDKFDSPSSTVKMSKINNACYGSTKFQSLCNLSKNKDSITDATMYEIKEEEIEDKHKNNLNLKLKDIKFKKDCLNPQMNEFLKEGDYPNFFTFLCTVSDKSNNNHTKSKSIQFNSESTE